MRIKVKIAASWTLKRVMNDMPKFFSAEKMDPLDPDDPWVVVELIDTVGDRVPIGTMSYYPALGVFCPSIPLEDEHNYVFLDLRKRFNMSVGDCLRMGELIAALLGGESKESFLKSLGALVSGAPDKATKGLHPFIQKAMEHLKKRVSNMGGTGKASIQEWSDFFFRASSPIYGKYSQNSYHIRTFATPPGMSPDDVPHFPSITPPGPKPQWHGDQVMNAVTDTATKAIDPAYFSAMLRGGSRAKMQENQIAMINAVEVLKGSSSALAYERGQDHPTLTPADMKEITKNIVLEDFGGGSVARAILTKLSVPKRKSKGFTQTLAKALDPSNSPIATRMKLLSKIYRGAMGTFLSSK